MSRIEAPITPIRELGWLPAYASHPMYPASIHAPKVPLNQLGWMGAGTPQLVSAAAPFAAIGAGALASSIPAIASFAGPIGTAVGAVVGIIAGLIAAHEQRIKDAKNENAAAAVCVTSFYNICQQIVNAYNSGQLGASDAIAQLQSLDQSTYSALRSYVGTPGTAWNSAQSGVCNKSCTVGCCLYNTYLHPDIAGVPGRKGIIPLIQAGGGSKILAGISASSYGFPAMPAIPITINPPSAIPTTASSVESSLTSLFSGGSSGSSLLPLLLLAGAAFLVLR